MKAAKLNGVKRVVITSSVAAIMVTEGHVPKEIFTEEDWSHVPSCGAYEKSKTLAEKAAWEF
jgi:nucleoside-diphosphate-sugar epimerase